MYAFCALVILIMGAASIFSFVALKSVAKRNDDPPEKVKLRKRIKILAYVIIAFAVIFFCVYFSAFLGFVGIVAVFFDIKFCLELFSFDSRHPSHQSNDVPTQQSQSQQQSQSSQQSQPQAQSRPQYSSHPQAQEQAQPQKSHFCPHCGAELQEESFFCGHCGNKI